MTPKSPLKQRVRTFVCVIKTRYGPYDGSMLVVDEQKDTMLVRQGAARLLELESYISHPILYHTKQGFPDMNVQGFV